MSIEEVRAILNGNKEAPKAPSKPHEDFSNTQRALQYAHGMSTTYGSIADILSKYIGAPVVKGVMNLENTTGRALHGTQKGDDLKPYEEMFDPETIESVHGVLANPKATQYLQQKLNTIAGRELMPEEGDTVGNALHTFGEFTAPLPGAGYVPAAKAGVKALGKTVLRNSVPSAGATAMLQTPHMTDEGGIPRIAEDVAKIGLGSLAGKKLATKAGILPKEVMSEEILAKAKPDIHKPGPARTFHLAEKHNVELPYNVGLGSDAADFVANNYLNTSLFTPRKYKEGVARANESMANKIKDTLEGISPTKLSPTAASEEFATSAKASKSAAKKEANRLYEEVEALIPEGESIIPKNTLESFNSKAMKKLFSKDIPTGASKKVIDKINALKEKWGLNIPESISKEYKNSPKILEAYMKRPVPVEKLWEARKDLREMLKHEKDVQGAEGYIKHLIGDITKDIKSYDNPEFISKLAEADKYMAESVAAPFYNRTAKNITKSIEPSSAYNQMSSVTGIRKLRKMVKPEEFNNMRRVKAEELIESAFTREGVERGSMVTGNMAALFGKGPKKNEVLVELFGPQEYKKLSELSEIANSFSKAGSNLLNTSMTTPTAETWKALKKVGMAATGLMVGGTAAGVPVAAAVIGTPQLLGRIATNPKIVNAMRAWAINRQKGNEKYADTLLRKALKLIKTEESKMVLTHEIDEDE